MSLRAKFGGRPNDYPEILIIGDSMLKHLDSRQLSRSLDSKVSIISLPGAKMEYILLAAKFASGDFLKQVVIFGGTNNLATKENKPKMGPSKLIRKVKLFETQFSQYNSETKIRLCQIINRPRSENTRIESHIDRYDLMLESNSWDSRTKVIQFEPMPKEWFTDGLHLNQKGNENLAKTFERELRDD